MKLACTVKKVETYNDRLHVTLEGQCIAENPDFRFANEQQLVIPDTPVTRRAYYVGRKVEIDAQPLAD